MDVSVPTERVLAIIPNEGRGQVRGRGRPGIADARAHREIVGPDIDVVAVQSHHAPGERSHLQHSGGRRMKLRNDKGNGEREVERDTERMASPPPDEWA